MSLQIGITDQSGKTVDLYIPRKCSASNRIIGAKDHASVQLNIGHVDQDGVYTGEFTTVAFSGAVRKQGKADEALTAIAQEKKLVKNIFQTQFAKLD